MNFSALTASIINIFSNCFLFIIKLWAATISGSVALLSDAFNSLTDMIASVAIFICVKISEEEADEGHPFGHTRAEPIAGLIVAVLAGILGFEVMRTSVVKFLSGDGVIIGTSAFVVLAVTMVIKGVSSFFFFAVAERTKSPAIKATAMDSLMDVFVSGAAFVGILGVYFGYDFLDPLAGFIISFWIIYTGYRIGVENIDYLMGSAPPESMVDDVRFAAIEVDGVEAVRSVRAHYVGPVIHVEVYIDVVGDLSTGESHVILRKVEKEVESIPAIQKAFIQINPI